MHVEMIVTLGAVAAALIPITIVARGMYRAWKKIDAFLEDWHGEPERPGREAVPSMPARMVAVETRLKTIEGVVHYHHGQQF
jgi:hypothetical protein